MKKYLLTALLGVFSLFGFVNANTVGNFTSDSELSSFSFSSSDYLYIPDYISDSNLNPSDPIFYVCVSSSSDGFYIGEDVNSEICNLVSSSNYCVYSPFTWGDGGIGFYSDSSCTSSVEKSGNIYYSASLITYSSSSDGSDSDSSPLLSGGTTAFSGIISSLGSAVSEFIPYVAYIGIGLLGAIIGFVAIKRLINRVRAKIFGTFSGGRRR